MRLDRRLCLALALPLALAACGPDPAANDGADGNVSDVDAIVPEPDPQPEPQPEPEPQPAPQPPPAPPCGQPITVTEPYTCPGPCLALPGRPGCTPMNRMCTRTRQLPPIPCEGPRAGPAVIVPEAAEPAPPADVANVGR